VPSSSVTFVEAEVALLFGAPIDTSASVLIRVPIVLQAILSSSDGAQRKKLTVPVGLGKTGNSPSTNPTSFTSVPGSTVPCGSACVFGDGFCFIVSKHSVSELV